MVDYREIFEEFPDGVTLHDAADGSILEANQQFGDMLGYTPEELLELDFDALHVDEPPYTAERAEQFLQRAATEGPQTFEWLAETKAGDPYPVEVHLSRTTIGDEDRILAVVRDITERKQREQTLERLVEGTADLIGASSREETAQTAVEIARTVLNAPLAGVHLLTEDGRLEAVATMDSVRDDLGEPPLYELGIDNPVDQLVWEVFESGESRYIDDVGAMPDLAKETPARSGIIHPLDERGVLIVSTTEPGGFDESARLYVELLAQALTAALDTIERETVVRRHKQRLERLHDAAEAIHRADTREEIAQRVVEAAEDILDFPIVTVRFYSDAVDGLVPVAVSESTEEILGSLSVFSADGGSLNWASYEAGTTEIYEDISDIERAHDADTPIASLMLIPLAEHGTISVADTSPHSFDDVDRFHGELLAGTAEVALSQLDRKSALIRQRDELERQNERLERFAGVVSHDLRNPLNVAQGRLQLATEECDSEHLDTVDRAHDRMAALIEDLLTLAREGEKISAVESVDLGALFDECWRNVDTSGATRTTTFDGTIRADRSRLRQLLENLIRNSVEHAGPEVTITLGRVPGGFYVEDDGPGIPVDDREAVLEPGYSTAESGTGFGLAIVQEIARAHGWSLSVTEGAAGGVRFEITGVEAGQ